jgi:DNA-binding NarL/FixJ family response regulator
VEKTVTFVAAAAEQFEFQHSRICPGNPHSWFSEAPIAFRAAICKLQNQIRFVMTKLRSAPAQPIGEHTTPVMSSGSDTYRSTRVSGSASAKSRFTTFNILIIDDHPIVREGLTDMISQEQGLNVCGHAQSTEDAIPKITALKPDLVLLDISLADGHGIDLLKTIKEQFPKLVVLILSMHDENVFGVRALRAGAAGYVMKQASPEQVLAAIRKTLGGEIYVSENLQRRMVQQFRGSRVPRTGSPLEDLSDRELEVFGLLGKGMTTRQIAEHLHLSIKTIESHRAKIKEKLNLKNSMELLQHAIQWSQAMA